MNLYNAFKTNGDLEKEGVWLEYGDNQGGKPVRILIARAGGKNTAFAKALEKATRPYRKALQLGTLDNSVADRLHREVFAKTVVKGWENVEGPDGELMTFTEENVIKLFTDLPDLFADVREQANSVAIYREEVRESDLGNSGTSLSTD